MGRKSLRRCQWEEGSCRQTPIVLWEHSECGGGGGGPRGDHVQNHVLPLKDIQNQGALRPQTEFLGASPTSLFFDTQRLLRQAPGQPSSSGTPGLRDEPDCAVNTPRSSLKQNSQGVGINHPASSDLKQDSSPRGPKGTKSQLPTAVTCSLIHTILAASLPCLISLHTCLCFPESSPIFASESASEGTQPKTESVHSFSRVGYRFLTFLPSYGHKQ